MLFLHNGKPGGRIAVASFGVVFIPGIVVGFQVEGTGAIGIDRNTRVDFGIEGLSSVTGVLLRSVSLMPTFLAVGLPASRASTLVIGASVADAPSSTI